VQGNYFRDGEVTEKKNGLAIFLHGCMLMIPAIDLD
jgi:hypothetical protein